MLGELEGKKDGEKQVCCCDADMEAESRNERGLRFLGMATLEQQCICEGRKRRRDEHKKEDDTLVFDTTSGYREAEDTCLSLARKQHHSASSGPRPAPATERQTLWLCKSKTST